jgi:FkbM family methyltransferase
METAAAGETAVVKIGDIPLELQLKNIHERRYLDWINGKFYPQAEIDRQLFQRFIKPGDRVLDAGANIGMTALECLAEGAANVLCIEPIPELAARIKKLESPNLSVIQAALSDRNGSLEIRRSVTHNQGSTYRPEVMAKFPKIFEGETQMLAVPAVTIDGLLKSRRHPRFTVWKLDVEGAEADVLKGAEWALQNMPPRVIMAELFDFVLKEFIERISLTHPRWRRALLSKKTNKLVLLDHEPVDMTGYHGGSPMYAFLRGGPAAATDPQNL